MDFPEWSREDLDERFGRLPAHSEAPTRAELQARRDAEAEYYTDAPHFDEDEWDLHDPWTTIPDEGIKMALHAIVRPSTSDEEIRRRIANELLYPHEVAIVSHLPTDRVGRQALIIVAALGGPIRADGAMVMVMVRGPRGNAIDI